MTAYIKKGFTLIELLIVIAILGVLAVVVLVAINPVQQLARTRDAGRTSTVSQLGHAMQAYYTAHNGVYPTDFDDLVTTGELTSIPGEVSNTLTTACTGVDDTDSGWCYDADNTNGTFAVWSALEADVNLNIDTTSCAGTVAFAAYLSDSGSTCIVCDAAPTAASTVAVCDN